MSLCEGHVCRLVCICVCGMYEEEYVCVFVFVYVVCMWRSMCVFEWIYMCLVFVCVCVLLTFACVTPDSFLGHWSPNDMLGFFK